MNPFLPRSDRFVTLYLVRPLNRVFTRWVSKGIPVLMYHGISKKNIAYSHPYYQTVTDPEIFQMHMDLLDKSGCSVIRLKDIQKHMQNLSEDSRNRIVITFDDGYKDFAETAFPILEKYKFTATVFLASGYVGSLLMNRECLDWDDVRKLASKGIDFGSHTVTHPVLHTLTDGEIRREIGMSKVDIQDKIGLPVVTFSYPYAFPQENTVFIRKLRQILVEYGYECAVTTRIGLFRKDHDRLLIRRVPINTHDDAKFFTAKLKGNYDWLFRIQYLSRIKSRLNRDEVFLPSGPM